MRNLLLLWCLLLPAIVTSFSAEAARNKLAVAFASPSGKLSLCPELIIPEPLDPTAILLLSNSVQNLSERIRSCKTNAAFLQGSLTSLRTFTNEQAAAKGNFPGPVPVVYYSTTDDLSAVSEAGADGIMVQVCGGNELKSIDELTSDSAWVETCKEAIAAGLQPIPEVTIGEATASSWSEDDVVSMVGKVVDATGIEPVSLVLTVNPAADEEEEQQVTIPPVPKSIKVPVLGSVRATAGDNRLSAETSRFKEAGFTGTVLRSDCVPGFRLQPDLEVVSRFWEACITDLKSTRSKSFSFRSKNNMEKGAMSQWGSLQKSIVESGALGDPEDSYSVVDEAAGDYKGFA